MEMIWRVRLKTGLCVGAKIFTTELALKGNSSTCQIKIKGARVGAFYIE